MFPEPSGKPRVTAAHNTSSTSLYLSWQAPELNTIHGEFLGYKISYRPRDVGEGKAVEVPIDNVRATVSLFEKSLWLLSFWPTTFIKHDSASTYSSGFWEKAFNMYFMDRTICSYCPSSIGVNSINSSQFGRFMTSVVAPINRTRLQSS
jgi:hypothetical protein